MRNRVIILLLSTFMVVGVACKAKKVQNETKTTLKPSGAWQLVEINSRKIIISSDNDRIPSIVINDTTTQIRGNNGCNSYGGVAKFNNDNAKFDIQFTTKMFCINAIDAEFDSTLQVVNLWVVEKNRLILKNGTDVLLQFEPLKSK